VPPTGTSRVLLPSCPFSSKYPEHVDLVLDKILFPPRPANAPPQPWADTRAAVAALRKAHPNPYIFNLDTICALLERRVLADAPGGAAGVGPDGGPTAGTVVQLLAPSAGAVRPPVAWGDLYGCYAGARRSGRHMKVLWEEEATQLHLLASLVALLRS